MKNMVALTASDIAGLLPYLQGRVKIGFFTKENITSSQHITLMSIYSRSRCTMGELAQTLGVTMPTVTGLISRLVRLKMVARSVSDTDRRKVYVELTKKGLMHVNEFKDTAKRTWAELLAVLTPQELRSFRRSWLKLGNFLRIQKHEE